MDRKRAIAQMAGMEPVAKGFSSSLSLLDARDIHLRGDGLDKMHPGQRVTETGVFVSSVQ